MSAYLHSNLCALAQARPTHVLHVPSYTKIIVVRACVRACVRASVRTGVHRKRVDPGEKKLCFFAKLKSGAATRGSRTRPATVLTLD